MKTTIADIAKKAGVSKATVSRVLNNRPEGVGSETRLRIQELILETGFQPSGFARGLATGKSRSVGLIIPDITNPFYSQMVRGIEDTLNTAGYSLFLCNSDRDLTKEKRYINLLMEKEVDGVILDSAESNCDCQVELLEKNNKPFVLLDRMVEGTKKRSGVYVDNTHGARLAADFLFSRPGCSLLFLNGPSDLSQSQQRLAGVQQVFREKGLQESQLRIFYSDFTMEGGYQVIANLLQEGGVDSTRKMPPFTALFAANDLMAIGALRALKQAGILIPEQVEVIGFDDIELAGLVEPPLSTVSQPSLEMGSRSAALLLQMINGKVARPRSITLMPNILLRGTTRA
ncbi:LacI family transcriptional regulator [bacterium]|nr:LacI family transcriptional regulator [bacterium]